MTVLPARLLASAVLLAALSPALVPAAQAASRAGAAGYVVPLEGMDRECPYRIIPKGGNDGLCPEELETDVAPGDRVIPGEGVVMQYVPDSAGEDPEEFTAPFEIPAPEKKDGYIFSLVTAIAGSGEESVQLTANRSAGTSPDPAAAPSGSGNSSGGHLRVAMAGSLPPAVSAVVRLCHEHPRPGRKDPGEGCPGLLIISGPDELTAEGSYSFAEISFQGGIRPRGVCALGAETARAADTGAGGERQGTDQGSPESCSATVMPLGGPGETSRADLLISSKALDPDLCRRLLASTAAPAPDPAPDPTAALAPAPATDPSAKPSAAPASAQSPDRELWRLRISITAAPLP